MAQGPDGTWQSYDDASNYYSERSDLAKGSCYSYISIINKLRGYHLNGELPVHRICKGHFSESDHKMRFVKDIFTRTYKRHFEKGVSFSKCLLLKRGFVICASSPLTVHVLLLLVVGIPKANFKALPSKFFPVAAECFHDMPVLAGTPKLFRHSNQATATPGVFLRLSPYLY